VGNRIKCFLDNTVITDGATTSNSGKASLFVNFTNFRTAFAGGGLMWYTISYSLNSSIITISYEQLIQDTKLLQLYAQSPSTYPYRSLSQPFSTTAQSLFTFGFDFDFETDDLYNLPFRGNKAKALDDFLTCFMPEIIINKLTEEVNADTQYFCKVAEYIYTSKALETEKKGWVELEDKEGCISCDKFLNIVKIHSSFIEHLLIEMELLKKS
jgi:hypothetical protein